jgi:tetratricopeptide (TPR) repeat protein
MRVLAAWILALFFCAGPVSASSLQDTQANIHYNLALKHYQAQKLDEANQAVAKALSLVPEHPQANLLSGLIACQQNRFKDAIAPLKIAAKSMPTNADVQNNLGVAYFQLGRFGEAADAFRAVLKLSPGRTDAAMNLGVLALRQKDWVSAKAAFNEVLKVQPENGRAWLGLAEAEDGTGNREGYFKAQAKALELNPGDKALRLQLGERLYQAERIDEAQKILLPLKGQGDPTVEFLLGVLAYRQADFERSREHFEAALKARPDYSEARFNLAITLYDQGRYPEALAQFRAVLEKHPDDEEAQRNLDLTRQAAVRAHLKDGSQDFLKADYAGALRRWRQALELDPDNKVVKDLVDTAQAQLKLQAEELAEEGKVAWDAGRKEDAILAWARALERDPANTAAQNGLDGAKNEVKRLVAAYRAEAEAALDEGRLVQARMNIDKLTPLDAAVGAELRARLKTEQTVRFRKAVEAAQAAAKKGALNDAIAYWEQALQILPEDKIAAASLNAAKVAWRQAYREANAQAEAAEKAGKKALALAAYQRVLELEPSNGTAKTALKRLREGAKAKTLDAGQLDDLYYQGVYAYAAGDVEKALEFWKKVLAASPQHRLAKEALDRAKRRKGA